MVFYGRLVSDMIDKRFKINIYGPCVANKMIKNKKMKVYWHIDDLKVSHVDSKEVTKFMERI